MSAEKKQIRRPVKENPGKRLMSDRQAYVMDREAELFVGGEQDGLSF